MSTDVDLERGRYGGAVLFVMIVHWLARIPKDVLTVVATWAQIISTASLPVALFAIRTAKRDLARERRVVHELEILRDFVDMAPPGTLQSHYRDQLVAKLLMIHGSEDLPLTRAALFANPSTEAMDDFAAKWPDAPTDQALPDTHIRRFHMISWKDFYDEVVAAISRRVSD